MYRQEDGWLFPEQSRVEQSRVSRRVDDGGRRQGVGSVGASMSMSMSMWIVGGREEGGFAIRFEWQSQRCYSGGKPVGWLAGWLAGNVTITDLNPSRQPRGVQQSRSSEGRCKPMDP